jgi:Uma2 family endonuclease
VIHPSVDSCCPADLAVTCAAPTGGQFVAEPLLIVEVLSPSTATTDRDRKLLDYRTIPSLQDILVVSSTEPRIEHFRREPDGWKVHDLRGEGILRLEAFDVTLDLAELCAGLAPGPDRAERPRVVRATRPRGHGPYLRGYGRGPSPS